MLHERLLRLINGHPNETNYFAWQALHRSYPGPGDRCLPPYLQRSQFERMRDGAGLIIPVHANLRQFLESLPAREVDAVVLLDSQDWMAADEIARALERHRSHRQRRRSRDLSHRRHGVSAGERGACAAAADLASRRGAKRRWFRAGPIGNLRRLPLLRTALIVPSRELVSYSRMENYAMSDELPERRFRTLFISDVHLGARGSQAGRLLDFLRSHDADTIYLVGDIVDGWALQSGWHWPQSHNEARHHGADGVICRHIHHATIRDEHGVRYMNCGDSGRKHSHRNRRADRTLRKSANSGHSGYRLLIEFL